jgi:hypothetical protein
VITVQAAGEEPRVALTGIYAETYRKTPAGWRIQHVALLTDR